MKTLNALGRAIRWFSEPTVLGIFDPVLQCIAFGGAISWVLRR